MTGWHRRRRERVVRMGWPWTRADDERVVINNLFDQVCRGLEHIPDDEDPLAGLRRLYASTGNERYRRTLVACARWLKLNQHLK